MTQREHLLAVQRATGQVPERLLTAARCPDALAYLWSIFVRLRSRCTQTMGGARILFTDIAAYMQVTGQRLTPWEVSVIERVDDAYTEALRGD